MIGRKQNKDVFVLGEEALAGPMPVGEVGSAGGARESAARTTRKRVGPDPFRIDVEGTEGADVPAGRLGSDWPKRGGRTRWEQPSWRWVGGVAVTVLVAVVSVGGIGSVRLMGGSGHDEAHPEIAVEETPPKVQPAPAMHPPGADLKRDSRPLPTRGREGQTPQPRASSTGRPAVATPSTPVVATPSPPSPGGASGGRENFGFEG
jgi:hypothetical protein